MRHELSPEPRRRVFQRPEHEWLRVAAMVEPDWPALRRSAAQPGFDWDYVVQVADKHQLIGIAVWRLLAPELDGIRPTAPDYLAALRERRAGLNGEAREEWRRGMEKVAAVVGGLGVRWAVSGGPAQYLPLGMLDQVWPREWTDVDIWLDVADEAELARVATALGDPVMPMDPTWWRVRMGGGVEADLHTRLRYPQAEDGDRWFPWEHATMTEVAGVAFPIPDALHAVAMNATQTWGQVWQQSARLPLWGLARVAAWVGVPGWSWDALQGLLARNVRWCRENPLAPVADPRGQAENEWWCSAYRVAWVVETADRVYGVMPSEVSARGLLPPDLRPVRPMTSDAYDTRTMHRGDGGVVQRYSCQLASYPGDEAFLFDLQDCESVAARREVGLWDVRLDSAPNRPAGTWETRRVAGAS